MPTEGFCQSSSSEIKLRNNFWGSRILKSNTSVGALEQNVPTQLSCSSASTFSDFCSSCCFGLTPSEDFLLFLFSVSLSKQTDRQTGRRLAVSRQLRAFVWKSDLSCRPTPQLLLLLLRPDIWSQSSSPPPSLLSLWSGSHFLCFLRLKFEAKGKLWRKIPAGYLKIFPFTRVWAPLTLHHSWLCFFSF